MLCGLDFGTSNSALGVMQHAGPNLVKLEDNQTTLPSAVFFAEDPAHMLVGRAAINAYVAGDDGRLMRALKSVLGTDLIYDATRVHGKNMPFVDIVAAYLGRLKHKAELELGAPLSHVVLGRPVFFVDNNPTADAAAQTQLEAAARASGFSTISFLYEPLAAALCFEDTLEAETLALVADVGGGTADFSVVRVGPKLKHKADRSADILANTGVHVGGTDVDRLLSMATVMPKLGYQSAVRGAPLTFGAFPYFDLATWQRIHRVYGKKAWTELERMAFDAEQPKLLERLLALVDARLGHALAGEVEAAKIRLSGTPGTHIALPFGAPVAVDATQLQHATAEVAEKLTACATHALHQAGVGAVDVIFMTGGSSLMPLVQAAITAACPTARVAMGNMLGSVGLGLALESGRRYG